VRDASFEFGVESFSFWKVFAPDNAVVRFLSIVQIDFLNGGFSLGFNKEGDHLAGINQGKQLLTMLKKYLVFILR